MATRIFSIGRGRKGLGKGQAELAGRSRLRPDISRQRGGDSQSREIDEYKDRWYPVAPPYLDEFDDSDIADFWTQASGFTIVEDGSLGGTINFAAAGVVEQAGLFQEYADQSNFITDLDLVLRSKVATPAKGGIVDYTYNQFQLFDDNIDVSLAHEWVADRRDDGTANAGAARYILRVEYNTDVESESYWVDPIVALPNDWMLMRMAHVNGELRLFYSADPGRPSWIDVTPPAVSTFYGQVGGHGAYGWGFEIDIRQAGSSPLGGAYMGYYDWARDGRLL